MSERTRTKRDDGADIMSTHEQAAPAPADGEVELDEALAIGALVVCATPAIAEHLRQCHALARASAGERVWRTPDILTWQAWLRQQFERLLDDGRISQTLLNSAQEQLLWREVIATSAEGELLLRVDGAARSAARAFRLASRYRLDARTHHGTAETELFRRWQERFERRLTAENYCAAATLESLLADAFLEARDDVAVPTRAPLVLSGFTECPPAQLRLLAALKAHGAQVLELRHAHDRPVDVRCLAARETLEEVDLAVQFAVLHANAESSAATSPRQVVIAAANPENFRRPLERALTQAVTAGRLTDFQFEPPASLASDPAICDALLWLELAATRVSAASVRQILSSPSLAPADESFAARGAYLVAVGNSRRRRFNLPEICALLGGGDPTPAGSRVAQLQELMIKRRDMPASATLQTWSRLFASWLKVTGWPTRSEAAPQLRERLRDVLGALAKLSAVHPPCKARTALEQLRELAASTPLEVARHTPVRVVSADDAAFMRVDALWVLGMTDEAWPAPASAHPMLPYPEQRRARLETATPALAIGRAETLTARLRQAAAHVIFSFPRVDEDRTLRVTPLLDDLVVSTAPEGARPARGDTLSATVNRAPLEAVEDWRGPPLDTTRPVGGGTRLLADQSDCPFLAFATHRLHIRTPEPGDVGIERRDAGTLLHAALENAWRELHSSAALNAMTANARTALARQASLQAVRSLAKRMPALDATPQAALETERITTLVDAWLEHEQDRDEPFEVTAQEAAEDVMVGPLTLRTRTDRVDRLASGELVIIDYKTGRVGLGGWDHERLREPQVPLYATHAEGPVAGALVAQVRAGDMRFLGRVNRAGIVPGLRGKAASADGWAERLERWRESLAQLAQEAADGVATVTPAAGATSCQACDLRAACRRRYDGVTDDPNDV
ncbi:MAG: PD-(D/E)XK nuclease family protein [Pseudomonadota bacterium]